MATCLRSLKVSNTSLHQVEEYFACLRKSILCHASCSYRFLLSYANPLFIHICYFTSISFLGFLLLKSLHLKHPLNKPRDFDLFFTSVSAATVSSMSTIDMEVFSNLQLVVLTFLMLIGGEVFTSTVGLLFRKTQLRQRSMVQIEPGSINHIELSDLNNMENGTMMVQSHDSTSSRELKYNAIRYLTYVLMGFLLLVHVGGSLSILLYISLVSSVRDVLREKEIRVSTFSIFTTVSSFSNCGFMPTNENMLVFKKNSGLLLLIIPQVLLGNTLFPSCLRSLIWVLKRLTKRVEFDYLLKSSKEIGFYHLLPSLHSLLLVFTVAAFVVIQLILVCSMEWHSEALSGMSSYQKIIGALFLSVNSRHAGESIVDLSTLAPAVLVLFVIMMYLPPYTAFIPKEDEICTSRIVTEDKKSMGLIKSLVMSQLSYLAISVILICITERRKLSEDPLNFNILNIVIEVISAYGNVGFSTGYSCERRLKPDGNCKDEWYGFVGKWSSQGKLVLIFVMFFGRLKKFSMRGGKAWKLG